MYYYKDDHAVDYNLDRYKATQWTFSPSVFCTYIIACQLQ